MMYSEKLKHPNWQKKRLKILERDNFTCVHCRDNETTLHVHHKKYIGEPWEAPDEYLETVCEDCHSIIDEIESVIYNDTFSFIKIIKTKNKHCFVIIFVLGNGVVGQGAFAINSDKQGVFIRKEAIEEILKTINNE